MEGEKIDRVALKAMLKEIIKEEPDLFRGIIEEILVEHRLIVAPNQEIRAEKIERMIKEDFDEFDHTFKNLR